eukprot:3984851-Ditylum_brightwellii.AAC.1
MELEEYVEQIELLDNLKQKGSETIVVGDDSDGKKSSKKKKGTAESSTKKSGKLNTHKKSHFSGKPKYGIFFVCCANSLVVLRKLITPRTKLTMKLKKLQEKERNARALTILTL